MKQTHISIPKTRRLTIAVALLFMAMLALMAGGASAQVSSNYSFAQTNGSYVTVPSPTTVHASGWDDAVSNVPIGWTFTFNGNGYTTCNVSTKSYKTIRAYITSSVTITIKSKSPANWYIRNGIIPA